MKTLNPMLLALTLATLLCGSAARADNPIMMDTLAQLATTPSGLHNLVVTMPEKNNVDIDWVSFE